LKSEENARRAMGWISLGWGLKVKESKVKKTQKQNA
jgi:hypothetical protein